MIITGPWTNRSALQIIALELADSGRVATISSLVPVALYRHGLVDVNGKLTNHGKEVLEGFRDALRKARGETQL